MTGEFTLFFVIVIFSNFEIKLVDYLLLLFQGNGWTVHHTDMVWHQQVYEPWKVTLTGLPLSLFLSVSFSLSLSLSLKGFLVSSQSHLDI